MPTTDTLPQPMILAGDSPRTRRTDPTTSHEAGDRSQANIRETKLCVLRLVQQEQELTGQEINDLYALRASRSEWPAAKYDTPRKRAGELEKEGLLEVVGERDGRVFALTAAGLEAIAVKS